MEDPGLIATLIPADNSRYAECAFILPHNQEHCLEPTRVFADIPSIPSREPTPGADEFPETVHEYDSAYRIQLRFDKQLLNPSKGYGFGTSPTLCDVQLGYRGVLRGIGGNHFHITLNQQGRLILKVHSTHGLAVSYNGQADDEIRRNFTWMLDLEKENGDGEYDVVVHVPDKKGLAFKVQMATH